MGIGERWADGNARLAEFLKDPERSFELVKKLTGLSIGLSVASVSFSMTVTFVHQGDFMMVFASLALFWSGYVFAHYTSTGTLIHQSGEGDTIPEGRIQAFMAFAGILLILAGMSAVPYPAVRGDVLGTSVAALVTALGYVSAHYGFTGDPL